MNTIQYPPHPPPSWETTTTTGVPTTVPLADTGSAPGGTLIIAVSFIAIGLGLLTGSLARRPGQP